MPGKDFEQKVRDQLADFSLESVPEIWPRINAALHSNKKRRMLPWFFILILAVLGGTTLVWYNIQDNKKELVVKKETKENALERSNDKDLKTEHKLRVESPVVPEKNRSHNIEAAAINKNSTLSAKFYKQNVINETSEYIELATGSNKNLNGTDSIIESSQQHEKSQSNQTGSDTSFLENIPQNKSTAGSFITNDSSGLKPATPPLDKKKSSWKLSFIAGAGISGFRNNPFSFFENAQADFSFAPQYTNEFPDYYNGIPVVYKIPEYKNGFAFNAGFQAHKIIDKHNSIAFELNYALYQTKMRAGNKIDSILYNQLGSNLGSAYYLNDDKTVYTNQYHFLQPSANYFYQFNTNHKISMRWKIGLGGAYMIASNGLHYSKSNTVLIKNINLFNNPQIFISTGFEFGIGKTNPWYIGPQLRYFLKPSDKKTVYKNGHLSGIYLGASIPFKKNK